MAPGTFKLQKGQICLTDDEAQLDEALVDWIDTKTKLSKFDSFASDLHFLSVRTSAAGIFSLIWAYIVIILGPKDVRLWVEVDFVENFVAVILLLSLSVVWSMLNNFLLRKYRLVLPHIFTLAYNVLMTFCLIYFPTICCCRLYDRWERLACAYLGDRDEDYCLPIYSKILRPEVIGLACGFAVALFNLLHIITRVINFIVHMNSDGEPSLVGELLHDLGYSSRIPIYGISSSLGLIGGCMMLWANDFIYTFGDRHGGNHVYWSANSRAGFDILTLIQFSIPLWFLVNVLSMFVRFKPISDTKAMFYDFGMAIALMYISIRCATQLNHLVESCQAAREGMCPWVWQTIRPRQLAAIILALINSQIFLSLCLNRLRSPLQWAREKNRINVLLKSLAYNEDFGRMGKVYAHTWTDEQILSIFRIKTSGDKVREYFTRVLHRIRDEEVAAFSDKLSRRQVAMINFEGSIRQTVDSTTWDDEHLALLHITLYGEVENTQPKRSPIPRRYRLRIKNLKREA